MYQRQALTPKTPLEGRTTLRMEIAGTVAAVDGMLEADVVAESVVQAMADETFLILPHAEVLDYVRRKANDYDRWLGGMRKLRQRY